MGKSKILYITYDGVLDPLGTSQILPYIYGISNEKRKVHILSFEKKERFNSGYQNLKKDLLTKSINWTPVQFSKRGGIYGKLKDLFKMYVYSYFILKKERFNIIHCRGHTAVEVGLVMKKIYGTKVIFDFRGLWVDERVDKGGWDINKFMDRLQYKYFKNIEKNSLKACDKLVVLTKAVVDEVIRLGEIDKSKIQVIPCCADYEHFKILTSVQKTNARNELGIRTKDIVIGYLGSIGSMYKFDVYLDLLNIFKKRDLFFKGLVITKDVIKFKEIISEDKYLNLEDHIILKSASREEVPSALGAVDVLIAFTNPSYSKVAMSPTKMGESFACGIPIICNKGVGDVSQIMQIVKGGMLLPNLEEKSLELASEEISRVISYGGEILRVNSRKLLGLEKGIDSYEGIYKELETV